MDKIKKPTFVEVIEAAAKPYRELWHDTGKLNYSAIARFYKRRGFPISQPNFVRICNGEQKAGTRTLRATHHVFGVPSAILSEDTMSHEMEKALGDYRLSTLILAQRIEDLPKGDYQQVADLVRSFEDKAAELRRAIAYSSNVTALDPKKK